MAERKFDKSILSEEGTVKFDFMTSLQNIAMAKIVSNLWMNKINLKDLIFTHNEIGARCIERVYIWQEFENNIIANVAELPLTYSIIERLKNIVPIVGNSLYDWIKYHDCIFKNCVEFAYDQINHIAWTARGKIDYAQTTKNILADKNNRLSNDHKYKLACVNCLQYEIAIFAPNVLNRFYLHNVDINMLPMVHFWTARFTRDNTNLYELIQKYNPKLSTNDYIMMLLLKSNKFHGTFNEAAIKYMWDKIHVKRKAEFITLLFRQSRNQELKYTLLSSLDFEKQWEVFKKCSDIILNRILNDWLWEEYFLPIALHILDVMKPSSYLYILRHLSMKIGGLIKDDYMSLYNKHRYNIVFKELWQEGRDIFDRVNGISLETAVDTLLFPFPDINVIEFILNDLNNERRKRVIFNSPFLSYCVNFIRFGKWDVLNRFIKSILFIEENINRLKYRIFKQGWNLISEFLIFGRHKETNNFLSWPFESIAIKHYLCKPVPGVNRCCDSRLLSVVPNSKADFTDLDNLLKWFANSNLDEINRLKAEILNSYSNKFIRNLIQTENYELLDRFLNWCFSDNAQKMVNFKSNMYRRGDLQEFFRSESAFLIRKGNSFKKYNNFVVWLFANHEEIKEFNMWLLYPSEKSCSVCTFLLIESEYELADKFIKWCGTSGKEIKQFKAILMLSEDLISIFKYRISYKIELPFLIKWFNPSKELVEVFKHVCPEKKCPENFYNLLDYFLDNRSSFFSKFFKYLRRKKSVVFD